MTNLTSFSRSCLLQLTEMELMDAQDAKSYTGRLLGKPRAHPDCAHVVRLPSDTMFAHGLEYQCVKYEKGMYLLLSNDRAVQVQGGVSTGKDLFLLVTSLTKTCNSNIKLPQWKLSNSELALLPLQNLLGHEPMHLLREGTTGLWLLR